LEDIECFRVVVNKVISDSQAYSQGIREGDSVVGINGEWVAEYKDFVQKVTAAAYPITLVLRRSS
jgi:S1-C subfamily serine protease